MATFILTCFDRPGRLPLRLAKRADHLAHVTAHGEMVRLAGPLLDEAGDMTGSHFLLEAPDLAAVRAFHESDPYAIANLFFRVDMRLFLPVVGTVP